MRAGATILLVEDEPEQLEELRGAMDARGFQVIAMRSAARAVAWLRGGGGWSRPLVAVVDWDLRLSPDRSLSGTDLLCVLAGEAADCLTIVYTANADSFRVRSDIQRAHPRAWLHDKREGDPSLLARIGRMLDRGVADLRVEEGSRVVHLPTLAQYRHREAVRLLVHHPGAVTLPSDSATRAVRRFGDWLERRGSPVRVVSQGRRRYRLAVQEGPAPGALPESGAAGTAEPAPPHHLP